MDLNKPMAQKGVLDLRDWNFKSQGPIDLRGDWNFYWEDFYDADTEGLGEHIKPDAVIPVPRRWNRFELDDGRKLTSYGYATLTLKVILPNNITQTLDEPLRLSLTSADTAYKLYVFDEKGNRLSRPLFGGKVGKNKENSMPAWRRDESSVEPAKVLFLYWQISNFHLWGDGGGSPAAPRLGLDSEVSVEESEERARTYFAIGILVIMGVYHLIIFSLRREEKAALWFGLSCLFIATHQYLGGNYLSQHIPDLPLFFFQIKTDLILGLSYPLFIILFLKSLYPTITRTTYSKNLLRYSFIYTFIFLITPLDYSAYLIPVIVLMWVNGLTIIWSYFVYYKLIFVHRDSIAVLLFIGFSIFYITTIIEIIFISFSYSVPGVAAYGLAVSVLFQALVLALQNQRTYDEKLNAEIEAAEANKKALSIQKRITASFQRFVPEDFLKLLHKEEIEEVVLGDFVKQEMTVLFSDIRSFTTLSESMTPEDNFNFLNSYLKRMEPMIRENKGVIDKYIGDAIMAIFPESADDSVNAAISMLKGLKLYNTHRSNTGYVPIDIGIGVNTGELMLGTIGGNQRMEGTVISDAVNLASRLEGLTKAYGAALIASEDSISRLKNPSDFVIRVLDRVKVKGKTDAVTIYEILCEDTDNSFEQKYKNAEVIKSVLNLRQGGKLEEAISLLADTLKRQELEGIENLDKALSQHLFNLEKLKKSGVPEGWDGVIALDEK
jgi:class 3 adenylate cyclase